MPKKILLADDSITIQKVVELTFSDGDYEVTAVNNGAKAVQKLAEMRPDIILSDIIMPEKNGYEVCEYVKSHPDFRNIPVVLLTGTFEPFDPDRAEKAGCDAVVTKPFESQSLIHKVEELIAQSQSSASAAAEPEPAAASPWMDDAPAEPASAFTSASGGFPAAGSDAFGHDSDIFGAAPVPEATTEMPFDAPAPDQFGGGETRAFPRMSFDDLQQASINSPASIADNATPPPAPEPAAPSPWDEPADLSGETRAFTKMSFDDFGASPAPAAAPEAESPFGAPPPPDEFSGETRAFPRMSFDDLAQAAAPAPQAEPERTAEPSPWNEAPSASPFDSSSPFDAPQSASPFGDTDAPAFGGETKAFPKLSFDDLQQMAASTPPPATEQEPAPWGEPADDAPAFGGETRAFPKLSFDDFQTPAAEPEPRVEIASDPVADFAAPTASPEPSPWNEPPTVPDYSPPEPAPWSDPEPVADFGAAAAPETTPWNEPEPSGDDFSTPAPWSSEPEQQTASAEMETASPFAAPAAAEPAPVESLWSTTAETNAIDTPAAESFSTAGAAPFADPSSPFNEPLPEDVPFATETTPAPEPEPPASEPAWSPIAAAQAAAEPEEPVVPPPALAPDAPPMAIARGAELSDDQIDRIARRVIELMSDQVVRNIAWEVIPDLAEMVVKERIRQLEAEA
ncbi:MAG TPA: response regulator [Thermoanaerobaculia bacterium]|jgi:CheY-like chemotaxis protein